MVHCGQRTLIQGTFIKHTKLFLQSSRDADEAESSSAAECRLTMQYFAEFNETTAVAATDHACNGCPMLKRLVQSDGGRGGRTGILDVSNS